MKGLVIKDLEVSVGEKILLNKVSLTVKEGEVCVLMGPNGSGKSTLGSTIMGDPTYKIVSGSIIYNEEDITNLSADKRALKGLFLSFQVPEEIEGVTLEQLIKTSIQLKTAEHVKLFDLKKKIKSTLTRLNLPEAYASRDANVGFSGGEKKKAEVLQLLLTRPKFAILDEIEAGLDVDATKIVGEEIAKYKKETNSTLLIITHSKSILTALAPSHAYVLSQGSVIKEGNSSLIDSVLQEGFTCL